MTTQYARARAHVTNATNTQNAPTEITAAASGLLLPGGWYCGEHGTNRTCGPRGCYDRGGWVNVQTEASLTQQSAKISPHDFSVTRHATFQTAMQTPEHGTFDDLADVIGRVTRDIRDDA